jgi:transketolase
MATLPERCRDIRLAVLDAAEFQKVGHYGSTLSAVEILVSLYYGLLEVDADEPHRLDRDRLVLSKGHACTALYPILADLGFFDPRLLEIFTKLGSPLGDCPDMRHVKGIDFSAGSLGHGLSIAAGMAEGLRLQGVSSRVVAIIGDGEQNEGQIWEAAGYAGFRRLSHLLAICDRNEVCVDGRTEDVLGVEPIADRWRAFGWRVVEVNGHDLDALAAVWAEYDELRMQPDAPPTFVVAHTVSGKGIDFIEGDAAWHLGYLAGADREEAERQINAAAEGGRRS